MVQVNLFARLLQGIMLLPLLLSLLLIGAWSQIYTEWSDSTAGQRSMREAIQYGMIDGTIEVIQQTYYCDYTATGVNGIGYEQIYRIAAPDELHTVCAKWCDALNTATPTCADAQDGQDASGAACALNANRTACAVNTGGCTYAANRLWEGSHCFGYWADVGTEDRCDETHCGYCGFYTANITDAPKTYNNARRGSVSAVCTTDAHNMRTAYCNYIGTRDMNTVDDFCSEAGANGLIDNAAATACAGVRCNKTIDTLACCAADATCDSVLESGHGGGDFLDICELHTNGTAIWPGGANSPRGADVRPLLVANSSRAFCISSKCGSSDASTCCQQRVSCTSITDVDMFCGGRGLKSNAADERCTTATCQKESRNIFDPNSRTDEQICCNEPAKCTDWFALECGESYDDPVTDGNIVCQGTDCNIEVDRATCCRPEESNNGQQTARNSSADGSSAVENITENSLPSSATTPGPIGGGVASSSQPFVPSASVFATAAAHIFILCGQAY